MPVNALALPSRIVSSRAEVNGLLRDLTIAEGAKDPNPAGDRADNETATPRSVAAGSSPLLNSDEDKVAMIDTRNLTYSDVHPQQEAV